MSTGHELFCIWLCFICESISKLILLWEGRRELFSAVIIRVTFSQCTDSAVFQTTQYCVPQCVSLVHCWAHYSMAFLPGCNLTFLFHQKQFQIITLNAGRGGARSMKMRFWFVICRWFSSWLLSYLSAQHKRSVDLEGTLRNWEIISHGGITSAEREKESGCNCYTCPCEELFINK